MKNSMFFLIIIINSISSWAIPLQKAMQQNQVKATFTSTGSHSGNCVDMTLVNLTSSNLSIEINPDIYLEHEDTTAQDLLVAQELILVLKPKAQEHILLEAFCCERSHSCPKVNSVFNLKSYDDNALKSLCKFLAQSKAESYTKQGAIWAMQNGGCNSIEGNDSAIVMKLRNWVADVHQEKKVMPFDRWQYSKPAIVADTQLSIAYSGDLRLYDVKIGDSVITAIYDEENRPISTPQNSRVDAVKIFGNLTSYRLVYQAEAEGLPVNKKYYLRIKVNGVIRKESLFSI